MAERVVAQYGSWRSPISAEIVVAGGVDLRSAQGRALFDGRDLLWTEGRPAEGGRTALVRHTADGSLREVVPPHMSVRSGVHEYGGGDFAADAGTVYFCAAHDQRIYAVHSEFAPEPLTPLAAARYADITVDRPRRRLLCVREDHGVAGEPATSLVAIPLDAHAEVTVLCEGHDFYAAPRSSADGRHLCWLTWDHPNMPWDGTELWVAELRTDGSLAEPRRVAGARDEAVVQPEWGEDGTLYFVSDRNGWWNLYRWVQGSIECVCEREADFAAPPWSLGGATYDIVSPRQLIAAYCEGGIWSLAVLDPDAHTCTPVAVPYTEITHVRAAAGRGVVLCAGSPTEPLSIVHLDLERGTRTVLRRSRSLSLDPGYLSTPEAIEFPTSGGDTAHAFHYPPANRDFIGPPAERPPLLVMSHGGPTGAASTALDLKIQFWTSRGIAVLDVNYRGSSGYGRAYRRSLDGQWGVADVEDCIAGARTLAARGHADPSRLLIRGSSAGGYTTLCALTFHDAFRAGASYYGISDLEALLADTHKFESHYLDRLVGSYPERRDRYRARSPLHFTDRLACPVILFQGLDDRVVPPRQAEQMLAALRAKRLPVAYLAFPGEQHGFRRAESMRRALEAELYFYAHVLGFELAEPIAPIEIENL
jgi:dienelactone hydrolase/catechol 2,3-dioxygenase-like lactoylglutathione lyase family enzyme